MLWSFFMVGVSGFEPEASCSRSKRDTKLRHTPLLATVIIIRESRYKIKRFFKVLKREGRFSKKIEKHQKGTFLLLLYKLYIRIIFSTLCSDHGAYSVRTGEMEWKSAEKMGILSFMEAHFQ